VCCNLITQMNVCATNPNHPHRSPHTPPFYPVCHQAGQPDSLLEGEDDLIRWYTITESDLTLIRQRRGDAKRLGFAALSCLLRYSGHELEVDMSVPDPLIQ